jgi:predicted kinase
MAHELLRPPAARLVAIGGLSGTGKSTLAIALAPMLGAVPGAVVVRSDEVRKQLCGVGPLVRLGPESYTPRMSEQVYAEVLARAARVVRGGRAAVVDAVFVRPEVRAAVSRVAADAGVPFTGLWLDAPLETLLRRVGSRKGDTSDATAAVVRQQAAEDPGAIAWHRIDAEAGTETVAASAHTAIDHNG